MGLRNADSGILKLLNMQICPVMATYCGPGLEYNDYGASSSSMAFIQDRWNPLRCPSRHGQTFQTSQHVPPHWRSLGGVTYSGFRIRIDDCVPFSNLSAISQAGHFRYTIHPAHSRSGYVPDRSDRKALKFSLLLLEVRPHAAWGDKPKKSRLMDAPAVETHSL